VPQGTVRPARPADVPEIVALIRELAEFEQSLEHAQMTESQLTALLFGGTAEAPGVAATTPSGVPAAYCHVVEHHSVEHHSDDGRQLGGCAIWFLNVSTWNGTHGLYLEDLFVRPQLRGSGYGRSLLAALARVCVERGYQRFEWWVLDWNESALGFYRKLGAVAMDEWTVQRLTGDALTTLAAEAQA
jgi:GNAT superfamily N-acetyltransferase